MTTYRTVIAGSRSITEYDTVRMAIASVPFHVSEVVSGGADGVDTLGERWAEENDVPINQFIPEEYEEEADSREMPSPLVRNEKMAEYADALIAVWDGESRGTQHMIRQARNEDLHVHIIRPDSRRLDEFL